SSGALLALVCEVLERKTRGALVQPLQRAGDLQQRLLGLVQEDAAVFRAFLDAEHGSSARHAAAQRVAEVPLEIGRASAEVLELVREVEPHVRRAMRLDVAAARRLA